MFLEPEANILSCLSFPGGRIRKHLSGSWLSCCCVGGGFACLSITGRVIMGRYWRSSCVCVGRRLEFFIFPSTRPGLILLSPAGSRLKRSFQTDSSCQCLRQNIICARHSKTKLPCLACSNIYLISYKTFVETHEIEKFNKKGETRYRLRNS